MNFFGIKIIINDIERINYKKSLNIVINSSKSRYCGVELFPLYPKPQAPGRS